MNTEEKARVMLLSRVMNSFFKFDKVWMTAGIVITVLLFLLITGTAISDEMYFALPFAASVYMLMLFIMLVFNRTIAKNKASDEALLQRAGINGSVSYTETLSTMPFTAKDFKLRTYFNYKRTIIGYTSLLAVIVITEFVLYQCGIAENISVPINNIALSAYVLVNTAYIAFIILRDKSIAANRIFGIICVIIYFGGMALISLMDEKFKNTLGETSIPLYSWFISLSLLLLPCIVLFIIERLIIPKMKNRSWDLV